MLTYNFENVSGVLYEYIYRCIKEDIISGIIKPGEKLPSKRTFARNHGISTITIQNAYDQLISEGYVYTIEKKGYYVAQIKDIPTIQRESKVKYDIRIPKIKTYKYDLSGNQMNVANFPFSIWAKLTREVLSEKMDELMTKSPTSGIYELRCAISEHLKSFRGMVVDPDQIVIGAGTEYLYGILVQLMGKDRKYAIENPGYKKLVNIYGQQGIKPVYADIDECGLSIEGLNQSGAEIAHICPNHHFPTGITMPASRRYEMLSWANAASERYIIEDDYDSEFRLNGKPLPTLFSIDSSEKVVYMNTFSKSLTQTIRLSYMVLPVCLANKFYKEFSFLSCTVSNFEQYVLAEFINRGYLEKHINRMRLYYMRRRKSVLSILSKSSLGSRCKVIDNDSGLHFIMELDTSLKDEELKQRLLQKDMKIIALSEYYLTNSNRKEHNYILNYSNVDLELLPEACERIYECISV
ncbi:MAG: PLP-dependent aminotransferase family protein, partial [Clostridiales bacterium]|nr:PLP-dependent aminotransferase family protein [Clostridiales bacterium]